MCGLVVPSDEADLAADQLHVPNISSWRVPKVLGRDLGSSTGTARRDVCGGEEQSAEVSKLLQQLVTRDRVEAEVVTAGVDNVLTPQEGMVDVQHHAPSADEAIPGNLRKEKFDGGVVGLIARQVGKTKLETIVSVGEAPCYLTLHFRNILQETPVHVANVLQLNDRAV